IISAILKSSRIALKSKITNFRGVDLIDSLRVEKEAITIGVLEALEKRSTPGLYDLLYVHDRKLDNRINQLEYDIDESFQSGAALTELMETFSGVLGAHLKGN